MANDAVIFGLLGAGGILLTSAVTGSSIGQVLAGHPGSVSHTSTLSSGVAGGVQSAGGIVSSVGVNAGKILSSHVTGAKYTGPAGVLNADQEQFAATFAKATGLNINTVAAWLLNEEPASSTQAPNGANNWLNVGSDDSGFLGGGNPAWTSPVAAANFTAQWLAANQPSILHSVGESPVAQAEAIQDSGWALSHYGYSHIVDTLQGWGF